MENWNLQGEQDFGPFETARRRSPKIDARHYAPCKQRYGANGGYHRQALMQLGEVQTHHDQAENSKQAAYHQKDGDDPCCQPFAMNHRSSVGLQQ